MSWSKILTITTVVVFVFGLAMIDCAVAGEKLRVHGVSFTTDWKQIEVGDEEGHVIAIYKAKQLYVDDKTGEKMVSDEVNSLDINLKTGQDTVTGYGVEIFPNGDEIFRVHEGKPVGKGHWKGTWTYVKGSGKYEGIKGGGTWDSYSMRRGQPSYVEVEGEAEMPTQ